MQQILDYKEDTTGERYREFLVWFLRTLGVVFLIAGVIYWRPLIGLVDDPTVAFTALERPEQITLLIFALLMPVTATGLWFGASWGIGLIAMSLIIRLIMAFGFPQHFEPEYVVIGGHVAIIAIYVVLRLMIHRHR